MNEIELMERIRREKFVKNNGRVLRGINVLRTQYVNLADLKGGLSQDITDSEYADSINYLTEIKFINLRHKNTHTETTIADTELAYLEAKVSALGIKFLAGKINDECVER